MITQFRVQNYKALRDVTLDLTPIHVLIGPNDTGKTSILEAVAALCRSVDHPLPSAFSGLWDGGSLVWCGDAGLPVSLTAEVAGDPLSFKYSLSCQFLAAGRIAKVESENYESYPGNAGIAIGHNSDQTEVYRVALSGNPAPDPVRRLARVVSDAFVGVHSYRWIPSFLALPAAPDSNRRFRMETSGFGLVLCIDDITGYDVHQFLALEERFKRVFPHVESIKLLPERGFRAPSDDPRQVPMLAEADGKGLYFKFVGGGDPIRASQVSDGMLLVLAYLAILHLPEPPRVLLVEEPENGIHPKRLQDVLTILRDLVKEQSHTQVILTTHSPYVVDLFEPKEVTLCKKEGDGSISTHRLSDSKTVREQLDVFTLGEIWTAEGDEALADDTRSSEASS